MKLQVMKGGAAYRFSQAGHKPSVCVDSKHLSLLSRESIAQVYVESPTKMRRSWASLAAECTSGPRMAVDEMAMRRFKKQCANAAGTPTLESNPFR